MFLIPCAYTGAPTFTMNVVWKNKTSKIISLKTQCRLQRYSCVFFFVVSMLNTVVYMYGNVVFHALRVLLAGPLLRTRGSQKPTDSPTSSGTRRERHGMHEGRRSGFGARLGARPQGKKQAKKDWRRRDFAAWRDAKPRGRK